jgi:hypothetical protein
MRREFLGASLYYSLDTLSCLLALLNAIAVVTFRSKMVLGKANCFSSLASLFCKNAFCGFASEKTASQVSWREFLFAGRSLLFVCLWHSFECDCFCHFSIQEDCLGKGCLLLKFGVILYSLGALSCFLAQLNAIAFVIFQDNIGKALLLKCSFTFFKVAVSDYVLKRSPRKVFLYSVDALSCLVALLNSISLIYFLLEYERRASTVIPNYMFMISTVHCITHFS